MTAPLLQYQSPYIPYELAHQFFAAFSRFEYALKTSGFGRVVSGPRFEPNWQNFLNAVVLDANTSSELKSAVDFLVQYPPYIQTGPNTYVDWQPMQLTVSTDGAKALQAAKQVRNNLFHGGKDSPHGDFARNEKLLRAALTVLNACLEQNPAIKTAYQAP